jgi:methionyl-tRNA formyltransferase
LRILLFGDGEWAGNSLRELVKAGFTVVGIVARVSPSTECLAMAAKQLQVPFLQPPRVNSTAFVQMTRELAPDLGLSIAYNQIFRRPLIDVAKLGFVNFHAGKLPQYRGRNVINWAIMNGETEIGLTAHYVDEGIDSGDIVLQTTLPIGWLDTYGEVLERVVNRFPSFVIEAVQLVANRAVKPRRQDEAAATYFGGRGPGDEWLDWRDTSLNLYNKVRAITRPGPGARTVVADQPVVVWKAYYECDWPRYTATPGQVVGRDREGVRVKTGDSTIVLQEIQTEGSSPAVPSWTIGTRLGVNLLDLSFELIKRLPSLPPSA